MRILYLFIALLPFASFAQTDTATIEQYCQVKFESPLFSGKIIIDIDKGDKENAYKEHFVLDENRKPMRFNTVAAALNYMGKQGWILVNAYPVNAAPNTPVYHYLFKKRVKRSEVE